MMKWRSEKEMAPPQVAEGTLAEIRPGIQVWMGPSNCPRHIGHVLVVQDRWAVVGCDGQYIRLLRNGLTPIAPKGGI